MKWKATHYIKAVGLAPQRFMLNSGSYFTKQEWEQALDPSYEIDEKGGVVAASPDIPAAVSLKPVTTSEPGSSITPLRARVERLTDTQVRVSGKQRKLVVTLLPGDVVELRAVGCRERRIVPLSEVWAIGGKLSALKLKRDRKAARAAKRGV